MSKTPHTPIPWERTSSHTISGALQDGGVNRRAVPIRPLVCTIASRYEQDANADIILRAVNNFGALLAIARRISNGECTCNDGGPGFVCEVCEAVDVIQKVEGGR